MDILFAVCAGYAVRGSVCIQYLIVTSRDVCILRGREMFPEVQSPAAVVKSVANHYIMRWELTEIS